MRFIKQRNFFFKSCGFEQFFFVRNDSRINEKSQKALCFLVLKILGDEQSSQDL